MSKNPLYTNEISTAYKFLVDNKNDIILQNFVNDMQTKKMSHSDRWSACYDFLTENYPKVNSIIITGLTYYLED